MLLGIWIKVSWGMGVNNKKGKMEKKMKKLLEEIRELSGVVEGRMDKGAGWELFDEIGDLIRETMDMYDGINKDYAVTRVTRDNFSGVERRNVKKIVQYGRDVIEHILNAQKSLVKLNRAFEILS